MSRSGRSLQRQHLVRRFRDSRLRVLVVMPHLRESGGLRVVLDLTRRWAADGVATELFALHEATDGALGSPDPAVRLRYGVRGGRSFKTHAGAALLRLLRSARRHDVVVSGSEVGHGVLAGYLAARATGRPFVVLVQADLDAALEAWVPRPLRRGTRWVHARADAAVCVSPGLVEGVVANGVPAERVHVVLNGVDVDALRRAAEAVPVAAPSDRGPRVLALGRLTPHKGFDLLIRASAAARAAGAAHELVIAGEGPARAELEALVAELGADHVSLPGFCDRPAASLAGADLFVSSSRTEAMPLTLLEALALGVPTVATDCCEGSRLLLDHGRYGDLVAAESVDALTGALLAHLRRPERLRTMAAAGPAFARTFDSDRLAREHLRVLAAAARRKGPRLVRGTAPVATAATGEPGQPPVRAGSNRRALVE